MAKLIRKSFLLFPLPVPQCYVCGEVAIWPTDCPNWCGRCFMSADQQEIKDHYEEHLRKRRLANG